MPTVPTKPAQSLSYAGEDDGLWALLFELVPYVYRMPAGVKCSVASMATKAGQEIGRSIFPETLQRILVTLHEQPTGCELCWSSDYLYVRMEYFDKTLKHIPELEPVPGETSVAWHKRRSEYFNMQQMEAKVADLLVESKDFEDLLDIPLAPLRAA